MIPAASSSGFRASLRGEAKTQIPVKGIATLVLLTSIAGAGIYGCGYKASTPPSGFNPTTPTISSIAPNSAVAGNAAFTLTVNGTNFAIWNVERASADGGRRSRRPNRQSLFQ